MVRPQWRWLADHQSAISTVLSIVWAGLTAAGVFAGRSQQTPSDRNWLLDWAGKVAPVAFVVGYLFILAVFMHRVVPQFTIPLGGGYGTPSTRCATSRPACGRPRPHPSPGASIADAARPRWPIGPGQMAPPV